MTRRVNMQRNKGGTMPMLLGRGLSSVSVYVQPSNRKCALCGDHYESCRCVCPTCGAKIWKYERPIWNHHVCNPRKGR